MLKTPFIQSALQHSVPELRRSALDMSWMNLLRGPCPKESVELNKTTPTAHFECNAFRCVDLQEEEEEEEAKPRLKTGDQVEANFRGHGKWLPGVVDRLRGTDRIDVLYHDGTRERGVRPEMVRPTGSGPVRCGLWSDCGVVHTNLGPG